MNFYNENDPRTARWLRNLIAAGLIPPGDVDETSILYLDYERLTRYTQCHFFAGIAGWSYALHLAGWPPNQPVWTGSCPCQPFSVAGKGLAEADERHLWPAFRDAIEICRPPRIYGEQVASKAGRVWLAGVRSDLEELGYAVGAADLCAAGIGAPHIRQRIYWVAHSGDHRAGGEFGEAGRCGRKPVATGTKGIRQAHGEISPGGVNARSEGSSHRLADAGDQRHRDETRRTRRRRQPERESELNRLADAQHDGRRPNEPGRGSQGGITDGRAGERVGDTVREGCEGQPFGLLRAGSEGHWDNCEIIHCRDGKSRRVGAGIPVLAHGVSARVAKLRGIGNAIVPQLAAEFIAASEEAIK